MRSFIVALLWLIASPALAQWGGASSVVNVANPQVVSAFTQQGAAVDANWEVGGYPLAGGVCASFGHTQPCYKFATLTRASAKTCASSDGFYSQVASGVPCMGTGTGYLIEEARTNSVLQSQNITTTAPWNNIGNFTVVNDATVAPDGTVTADKTTASGAGGGAGQLFTISGTAGTITAASAFVKPSGASQWVRFRLVLGVDVVSIYFNMATGAVGTASAPTGNITALSAFTPIAVANGFYRIGALVTTTTGTSLGVGVLPTSANSTNSNTGDEGYIWQVQAEAGASVTSPISTGGTATSRAADVVTMTIPPAFGSAYTIFSKGTPQAPAAYANVQSALELFFDTPNRTALRRNSTTAVPIAASAGGTGYTLTASGSPVWAQNVSGKEVLAAAAGDQAFSYNGGTPSTASAASLQTTPTSVVFGSGNNGGSFFFNGLLGRSTVFPTWRVPNAQLQAWTTP